MDQDLYALRIMPKENGIYYVHVKLNEAHIPGSPFPMLIGKLGADPALVLARGDGLAKGESGMFNNNLRPPAHPFTAIFLYDQYH